jgi:hypothetical protein
MQSWQAPLLITGCARSGTSALARGLSTHPGICMFNEYNLYYPPVIEESLWHRLSEMRGDNPPPTKIARDMPSFRATMARDLPDPAPSSVVRDWIFGLLRRPVTIYGDKMPYLYLGRMEEIVERFPGVRFLLTLRDGRAVVASQIRQYHRAVRNGEEPDRWMSPSVEEAEYLWLRSARKWLSLREDPPAPCLEVDYDRATAHPEELCRKLCEFVGMDYRQEDFRGLLEIYRPAPDVWRDEVPDLEERLSDEFREALAQLGY